MSEAEIVRDFSRALEHVRHGVEVVVDQGDMPIAILKAPESPRRTISEILALMPKDSTVVMDEDFAQDVAAGIESHREPLDASKWD